MVSESIYIKILRDNCGLVPASYHDTRIAKLEAENKTLKTENECLEESLRSVEKHLTAAKKRIARGGG